LVLFFSAPKSWFFSPTVYLVSDFCFLCFSLALRPRVVRSLFARGPMVHTPRLSESSWPVVLSMLGCQRPWMKLSRADEGGDVLWQKKRERFLLGDWWTPAFLTHSEKGGGSRYPSGGQRPGAACRSDQGAQQADKGREEGREDACSQNGEDGGPDHDED
jgi:hypothetical protein